VHNFRNIEIWKRSLEFSIEIIELGKTFPSSERFELTSQIVRSAVSIPSNIAEGSVRTTDKEFARFLDIALGSAFELETQLIIAYRIGNIPQKEYDKYINELNEIQKMIRAFKTRLK
jgi:four helix bundle protein